MMHEFGQGHTDNQYSEEEVARLWVKLRDVTRANPQSRILPIRDDTTKIIDVEAAPDWGPTSHDRP